MLVREILCFEGIWVCKMLFSIISKNLDSLQREVLGEISIDQSTFYFFYIMQFKMLSLRNMEVYWCWKKK